MPRKAPISEPPGYSTDINAFFQITEQNSPRDNVILHKILALIHKHTQIDFSEYKLTTVGRRVLRHMKISKKENLEEYLKYLEAKPEAAKDLCDEVFIHVTDFFRDPESFEALKTQIFPRLMKTQISGIPLRIWVPGCSTGEEAYSIAISLLEFAEEQKRAIPFQIFATDISEAAVEKARAGYYEVNQVENISKSRLTNFFDVHKDGYKIKRAIRDSCVFSRHDLTSNPPFAKIDLISCRNVLIYFEQSLQKRVLPIYHYSLNSHGFLWLGRSEAPNGISKLFALTDKTHKIFSKVNTATPLSFRFPTRFSGKTDATEKNTNPNLSAQDYQKEIDRIALSRYAPAGAVINADMEVVQVRGHTAPYLELPIGQPTYNFLKMIRPELLPEVRMTIQTALKTNAVVRKEGLIFIEEHTRRALNIEVVPINPMAPPKERQLLVFFEEVKNKQKKRMLELKSVGKKKEKLRQSKSAKDLYMAELLQELDSFREYQQSLAEGYEAAQEELTSSNEELQSTLEEYQSTNEELETAKEELQAANEELTTVNDELLVRNDELIRSEERFRHLVEGVREYAIYMLDADGNVVTWNDGARRIKGYDVGEVLGKHVSIFYTDEDQKSRKPQHELEFAISNGRSENEGWRIRKDGSQFWANVVITRINDHDRRLLGFSKVTRDMTEQKKSEKDRFEKQSLDLRLQQVQENEDQLRTLADTMPQLVWIANENGHIFWYNQRWFEYTGITQIQTENGGWEKVHHPDHLETVKATWANCVKTGTLFEMEFPLRGADGNYRWFLSRGLPLRNASGNIKSWFGTDTDIEEQRKIRDELSDALQIRDEFLSIASHELKTPLTSLKLQLQMTDRRTRPQYNNMPSASELSQSLIVALRQVDSITDLVEDLLDIARIKSGKFTLSSHSADVSGLIKIVVAQFAEQIKAANVKIEFDVEEKLIGHWDDHRLEQVIVNIIANAIKYAPNSTLRISSHRNGDSAQLVFADTGPGIPESMLPKIFERFERAGASRNVGGLGLGLYIVREIVEAHKGTVHVHSEIGKGTCFTIELPIKPETPSNNENSK